MDIKELDKISKEIHRLDLNFRQHCYSLLNDCELLCEDNVYDNFHWYLGMIKLEESKSRFYLCLTKRDCNGNLISRVKFLSAKADLRKRFYPYLLSSFLPYFVIHINKSLKSD